MNPLNWYLILSAFMFSTGVFGFLARKNIVIMFLSVELMLNAVNVSLISFGNGLFDLRGQILAVFVIALAAAEAAIGLVFIVALFRNKPTIQVDEMTELKG
jgi:NADH-quinone oxidoreductase subunit K